MSLFSANLKHLRLGSGKKSSELLDTIGFKQSQWNNYENDVSKPRFDDLVKIAKYFGVSESDLIHSDLTKSNLTAKGFEYKNTAKSNLKSNPLSNLKSKKGASSGMLQEGSYQYQKECKSCKEKDAIIENKDQLINSLQFALKIAQQRIAALESQQKKK